VTDRTVGSDLVFVRVRVRAAHRDGLVAVTSDGAPITVGIADDHAELPYRDNLRLLGTATDTEVLLVGRPDPARHATILGLALAPAGDGLALPDGWAGHVDLGYDRLHRSHLRHDPGESPDEPVGEIVPGTGDPALRLLRRQVERVVSGGRAVQALAGAERRRLDAARLETGALLVAALTDAARQRTRDAFGRLDGDDGHAFATAWLATAVYEQAATRALTEASWLPH
jgi:hypothetical protein